MLYAIFCYDSEEAVGAWTKEQDQTAMTNLMKVQEKWAREGKLGPVARLQPTRTASTLRKGRDTVVMDGPFAETKEALLGFFVVKCETQEEAVACARELSACYVSAGAFEVRPIGFWNPGPGG
jgi:hypothetical protein